MERAGWLMTLPSHGQMVVVAAGTAVVVWQQQQLEVAGLAAAPTQNLVAPHPGLVVGVGWAGG